MHKMSVDIQVFHVGKTGLAISEQLLSGPYKLAQRVLIELLTEYGSIKYLPRRGCNFLKHLMTAKNEFDVMVAFTASRSQIRSYLKTTENAYTPVDEKFADMRLDEIVLDSNYALLTVSVMNRAGMAVKIEAPPIKLG
jgi:hypothetical protein